MGGNMIGGMGMNGNMMDGMGMGVSSFSLFIHFAKTKVIVKVRLCLLLMISLPLNFIPRDLAQCTIILILFIIFFFRFISFPRKK